MKKLPEIQAVAFDLDGTLVDSIGDLAASCNAMRQALDLPLLEESVLLSFVGDGIGRMVHRALTNDHESLAEQSLWEKGFALFVRHYMEHLTDRTRPYPQVEDTLGLLKTLHLPLAVITNKSERFAAMILRQLGLEDEFSLLIGGDTLPEKKPHALPLLHACENFGIAPEHLLMVGDSRNDILAAKNAGCVSCGVMFGYGRMEELIRQPETTPDFTVHHFIDIYQTIKKNTE